MVLPISGPPIENGAVVIKGERIAGVGKWSQLRSVPGSMRVTDLGEVVLLPGLVNAHCHLDYTDMRIKRGDKSFTDWAREIIRTKRTWNLEQYRASWLRGARMLLESGTTTVGDIEAVPQLLPRAWNQTPLRVCSFLEMTGVASGKEPKIILRGALKEISELKSRDLTGLSPHALYSTVPELLRLTAKAARKTRVTMHVAESEEEFEMYAHRKGELFDWLSKVRDVSDCGETTPVAAVQRAGLLRRNFLAVHANYLTASDGRALARSGASVVHCPSSHSYFGHQRFPFEKLKRAGVNICLGTDSAASMRARELNMFSEMQQFARVYPDVPHAQILRMATGNGARGFGLEGVIGELRCKASADLIAVKFTGKVADVSSAVLFTKRVTHVFIRGRMHQPVT